MHDSRIIVVSAFGFLTLLSRKKVLPGDSGWVGISVMLFISFGLGFYSYNIPLT